MDSDVISSPAAGTAFTRNNGRVPAVIGVLPWSWKGDSNCGNMIHAAAARRMMKQYAEYERPGEWTEADIDRLKCEHSHIVYVTANLLRLGVPGDHPSIKQLVASQVPLARNIERAALPVVVFGLGSQAGLNGASEPRIAPETIRLLKVLSDHSRKIAVRGAFTAEVCVRLGIKNVEVVGCQSMFWHRTPRFSLKLSEPVLGVPDKIAFNFTYGPPEASLINQAIDQGYDVIGQGNTAEEELKSEDTDPSFTKSREFGWEVGTALEKGLIDRRRYEHWIKTHFYQFQRPEPWFNHMQRYCFSYGTRLHGNIAAMIAGVRAMWIVHDMRLKEVLDHFRLPSIAYKDVKNGVDLEALFDRADYSECAKIYPDRYRTLYEYVDRAGLPHCLPAPAVEVRTSISDALSQRKTPALA
jgi:hypothetical protein